MIQLLQQSGHNNIVVISWLYVYWVTLVLVLDSLELGLIHMIKLW